MPRFVEPKRMTAHLVLLDGEFQYLFDLDLDHYKLTRDGARVYIELEGFPAAPKEKSDVGVPAV